jgi:sulfoxide reductase heme-binding subunit YedZ
MTGLFPKNAPQPWLKPGVFAGALIPLVVTLWRGLTGALGADVVAVVLNQLGYLALTFLAASLLCTPVKILTGSGVAVRLRRMLGLFAFFYAGLHFLTYLIVDQGANLSAVLEDITKRNFILAGFLALVLLIPLAATSTNGAVRRMGFSRWKRLHRLAYVAGGLGALHFIWRVKTDYREPLVFVALIAAGFVLRAVAAFQSHVRPRKSPA